MIIKQILKKHGVYNKDLELDLLRELEKQEPMPQFVPIPQPYPVYQPTRYVPCYGDPVPNPWPYDVTTPADQPGYLFTTITQPVLTS